MRTSVSQLRKRNKANIVPGYIGRKTNSPSYRLPMAPSADLVQGSTESRILTLQRTIGNKRTIQEFSDPNSKISKLMGMNSRLEIGPGSGIIQASGLPKKIKSGIEAASGYDMSDVKVHYNSNSPAAIGAAAYTKGTDIYLGAGQEKHLLHEAWHAVQQKEGRVKPTGQVNGLALNDSPGLEREADTMGNRALRSLTIGDLDNSRMKSGAKSSQETAQFMAAVRELKTQTGGTCGCYSLWMAIESLKGKDDTLESLILEAARQSGSQLGENFTYKALENVVGKLNDLIEETKGYKVNVNKKEFSDGNALAEVLENSGSGEALMIAYSYKTLLAPQLPGPANQKGHWSIIEAYDSKSKQMTIANPHGTSHQVLVSQMIQANADLTGDFDWEAFAMRALGSPAMITSLASGIKRPESEVQKILTAVKKWKIKEPMDLKGYAVAITVS